MSANVSTNQFVRQLTRIALRSYTWTTLRGGLALLAASLVTTAAPASPVPIFTDVASAAGIAVQGPTAGSSWGDANADHYPDLWVSNHHGHAPNLFINNGDGTFTDAVSSLDFTASIGAVEWPDFHGAAWADSDNDGDQDLLVVTGAGAGRGESANWFYRNESPSLETLTFVNRANEVNLDYPMGRGRTPLWIDLNSDGLLDVALMNRARPEAPSVFMLQNMDATFEILHDTASANASWYENAWHAVRTFFHAGPADLGSATEFAQFGEFLVDSPGLEIVTYEKQIALWQLSLRSNSTQSPSSSALTKVLNWPELSPEPEKPLRGIQDAVVADFDGDLDSDWLLVRSRPWMQQIATLSPNHLEVNLAGTTTAPNTIILKTSGDLELELHPPWYDPSDPRSKQALVVHAGSTPVTVSNHRLLLDSSDERLHVSEKPRDSTPWIHASYSPKHERWRITNTTGPLNLVVHSTTPISSSKAQGFKPGLGTSRNLLLLNDKTLSVGKQQFAPTACQSGTAADFDNDMDIDVYLVCASGVTDAPDLLLLNRGKGKFDVHPQGLSTGRGNQVAAADYNNDGFVDLAVTNGAGAPPFSNRGTLQLFRNTPNDNHWLEIQLRGTRSARDAVGASVVVSTEKRNLLRLQDGGSHSFSQDHSRLHFGLGANTKAKRIEVSWPSGAKSVLTNVEVDQILQIIEPDTISGEISNE